MQWRSKRRKRKMSVSQNLSRRTSWPTSTPWLSHRSASITLSLAYSTMRTRSGSVDKLWLTRTSGPTYNQWTSRRCARVSCSASFASEAAAGSRSSSIAGGFSSRADHSVLMSSSEMTLCSRRVNYHPFSNLTWCTTITWTRWTTRVNVRGRSGLLTSRTSTSKTWRRVTKVDTLSSWTLAAVANTWTAGSALS